MALVSSNYLHIFVSQFCPNSHEKSKDFQRTSKSGEPNLKLEKFRKFPLCNMVDVADVCAWPFVEKNLILLINVNKRR